MKETGVENRRKLSRWKASYFFEKGKKYDKYHFEVIDTTSNQIIGHLVDLTLEGMKITSRESIRKDSIYKFRIELPEDVKNKHQIFVEVKCVWCQQDSNPESYNAGFKIISITPPFTEVIETLISQ